MFTIRDGVLIKYTGKDKDVTIPDSVTTIGEGVFENDTGLTSITMGNKVTSIDCWAFKGCKGLTSITIPDSVTSIGSGAFACCTSLESITIPDSVTSMGDWTFSGCTGLTSVTIGNSVTSIGYETFSGCTGLESIVVANSNKQYHSSGNCLINTESKTLIAGCKNSVIPDDGSVTSIGKDAFNRCYGLTSITIPDSVTSIGDGAFGYCTGLKTQKSIYKAFDLKNNKLYCRWYEFKEDEWSDEIKNTSLCNRGYHYCENLFDVFNYYSGLIDEDIAIYECEVIGISDETHFDSKKVCRSIKPVKRLYQKDVIRILNEGKP